MSAEPIVVNVHQYLYIKPSCCTPYTSTSMYGNYFSIKLEKEDFDLVWVPLKAEPEMRSWVQRAYM